jgi:general L-amino acid transport system permease protein
MFGFYPPELYWRPVVALADVLRGDRAGALRHRAAQDAVVLAAAPLPVLLAHLGRHDLGADLRWRPALPCRSSVPRSSCRTSSEAGATIAAFVLPILYWLFLAGPHRGRLGPSADRDGVRASDDIGGFMLAFIIGITGILLSLPLGIVLALGRQSDLFIINKFCVIFIEVIRGVPLIVGCSRRRFC